MTEALMDQEKAKQQKIKLNLLAVTENKCNCSSHNNPGDQMQIKHTYFYFPGRELLREHCLCFLCLQRDWAKYGEVCCY